MIIVSSSMNCAESALSKRQSRGLSSSFKVSKSPFSRIFSATLAVSSARAFAAHASRHANHRSRVSSKRHGKEEVIITVDLIMAQRRDDGTCKYLQVLAERFVVRVIVAMVFTHCHALNATVYCAAQLLQSI